nr:MAG TPA: hypothetical protein [Caudoviricetes sp.]
MEAQFRRAVNGLPCSSLLAEPGVAFRLRPVLFPPGYGSGITTGEHGLHGREWRQRMIWQITFH